MATGTALYRAEPTKPLWYNGLPYNNSTRRRFIEYHIAISDEGTDSGTDRACEGDDLNLQARRTGLSIGYDRRNLRAEVVGGELWDAWTR